MKSKTSCFNRTIFKKNFTHYWPIWALYFGYLLLILPVSIWQMASNQWMFEYYDGASRMYYIVEDVMSAVLLPIPIFTFAAVMALAVFSYLYSAKNANMIHALPVNRLELFVTNYLSGLSFLIIPEALTFVISVLVCLGNQITCIQYLLTGFLCQAGVTLFAYSLAVFVAMFTGQILAMPVYYFILNYLYVGCLYIISQVMGLISYGISETWNPGKSCILSPIYYLGNNLRSRVVFDESGEIAQGIRIVGTHLVAIYAVAGILIAIVAYQLYKRRQIETAGDWISIGIVKPIFRWGVALCGGVLISTGVAEMLQESRNVDVYVCMVVSIIIVGFICFFAAEMLLVKNFKVFRKKRFLEWAGFTAVAVLFVTLFKVDAFGIERRIPEADEIMSAFVYMDYPLQVEEEDIPVLLELHEQIIDSKKEYSKLARENSGYYYTTLRYYLKDGSVFERRYPLPVSETYTEDRKTPSGQILEWERKPENLRRRIFGINYAANEYVSGYIDLYDEEGANQNRFFNSAEAEQIVEALEKDIAEGNFATYYQNSISGEETVYYYNSISLDFYNRAGLYDNWSYYHNYRIYADSDSKADEVSGSMNSYISFGPECSHTVAALEELGIVDDTWKLYTMEEYENLEN